MSERVTARLRLELVDADDAGRIAGDEPSAMPPLWLAGDDVTFTLTVWPSGSVIMSSTLEMLTLRGQLQDDGEVLRFYYTPTQFPEGEE